MNVSKVVEIVGVVAVVVSLGMVAFELRQNANAAAAQAFLDLAVASNEPLHVFATDPTLAAIHLQIERGEMPASEVDLHRYELMLASSWYSMESAYMFREKGLLTEDDYSSWLEAVCADFAKPYQRHLIESGVIRLNAGFEAELRACGRSGS